MFDTDDFEKFDGDELSNKLISIIKNVDGFRDIIIHNSITMLRDSKFQMEYALDETIDNSIKIQDIDELMGWAVERELYEDCVILRNLKERITETFDTHLINK